MEATQTRTERITELEQHVKELAAKEEAQHQELLALAARTEAGVDERWDPQQAESYRGRATRQAVKAKRDVHVQRLRAEAELEGLLAAQVKESPQLGKDREELARIDAEIDVLKEKRKAVQARVWGAEGAARGHDLAYWRLTHEADAFSDGTAAM